MVQLSALFGSALLFVAVAATSNKVTQPQKEQAVLGSFTPQGCWKDVVLSKDAMNKQVTFKASNISSSGCGSRCLDNNQPVFAMAGESCYCANKYPSEGGLVDNSQCNFPCKANATEACGNKGQSRFSVWNTGIQVEVPYLDKKAKSSTTKSSVTGTPTSKKSVKKTTTPASSSEATPTSSVESTTTEIETSTTATSASTASTAAAQPSNAVSKNMAGAGVAILAAALAL
ncbi:unnamed protein product [Clonostachys byssicola]|uniref:WSC domain-containing protein n=1 Tax=Clonostachys byssicola TaxID=160290 RepID=A0A9N9U924_9HYPO|nr:unnamed protein product [Clonostachys byssicola]